ncbi:hypothetical protein ACQ4PT_044505 [Festuca glaucescens]
MSVDYNQHRTDIVSTDAVSSHNGGVFIVVTGSLTTEADGVCQRFTQSFFLAPQGDGGYFVLNDILRVMLKTSPVGINRGANQERSGSSHSDGPVVSESREAKRLSTHNQHVAVESKVIGDWEVLNHAVDGTDTETDDVSAEPPVQVNREDTEETPDAASHPPPQAPKEATKLRF